MLIALPNEDGSFTCTLFMPYDNHEYAFNDLTSDEKIDQFFKTVFPDFHSLMPNLIENWHQHPLRLFLLSDVTLGLWVNLL